MADREQIEEMIRQRAAARGLDPDFAVRVAELESSMNPNARNRRSTASGLFQLTDARRREIGVPAKKAATIEEQIDHGITSLLMAEKYLEGRLERRPEFFETYAAHFSGPFGSVKVLKADPQAPINQVLSGKAVSSNPKLKGRTTGEVQENWRSKFEDLVQKKAAVAAPVKEPAPAELYPTSEPDWGAIGRSQLTAQGPRPAVEEPVAAEPVAMMAGGGMVDDDESPFNQRLTRMVEMARSDGDFARINRMLAGGPQGFDEGGEVKKGRSAKEMLAEMEPTAEELERASKPAFGVVPSSGKGRKQGRVSEALQSGEAQLAAAKGLTMLPQNVVGAPVDIAALVARPFGYNVEKPVMGSEWLKEKSRAAGLAFQEPEDPTLRAFFTAGDISSNLINPAGATRTAVRGVEKTGQAAKELAEFATRPVERDPFFSGPMGRQRGAVRPPGGGVPALPEGGVTADRAMSGMENWLAQGEQNLSGLGAPMEVRDAIKNFWRTKATNYVSRQMGTPDDPVFKQIMSGALTTPQLEKDFRRYTLEQARVGKTKVNPETGEERFYPKYPEAIEDLTRKYDELTGIVPMVITQRPGLLESSQRWFGPEGNRLATQKQEELLDKMVAAGVPVERINVPPVNLITRGADNKTVSSSFRTSVPERILEGLEFVGPQREGRQMSSEALRRAVANEEPIFDIDVASPLRDVLNPDYINKYLATLSPKEIAKTRFEDVVTNSAKYRLKQFERETLVSDIKAGKRVNEKFFAQGVSAPLLQFNEGPLAGYAWKRIEDAEATVPEGAYVGHSVGGYARGGAYGPEKHKLFNEGKYQVYTLRNNRNRPVTTIEVKMENESTPVVTQIKGNGRATGNTAPENYDQAVEAFFRDYLKPAQINESDSYLTPRLQSYKALLAERKAQESQRAGDEQLRQLRREFGLDDE